MQRILYYRSILRITGQLISISSQNYRHSLEHYYIYDTLVYFFNIFFVEYTSGNSRCGVADAERIVSVYPYCNTYVSCATWTTNVNGAFLPLLRTTQLNNTRT